MKHDDVACMNETSIHASGGGLCAVGKVASVPAAVRLAILGGRLCELAAVCYLAAPPAFVNAASIITGETKVLTI